MRLKSFAAKAGANAQILAKLEYFNPAGSVKDRIANAMINEAEKSGALKPGATIIDRPPATPVSVWQQLQLPAATASSSPCRKP